MISFGSLEFRATSNGYLMRLLSPGRNPATPTSPAQRNRRSGQRSRQARAERRRAARHNSPAWVEAGMTQLSIAEARDDEAVAPLAAMLSCDMPAPTHVGELWRAARRRSARACRECWPERLLRRAGEVGATGLRLGERSSMR